MRNPAEWSNYVHVRLKIMQLTTRTSSSTTDCSLNMRTQSTICQKRLRSYTHNVDVDGRVVDIKHMEQTWVAVTD